MRKIPFKEIRHPLHLGRAKNLFGFNEAESLVIPSVGQEDFDRWTV